MESKNICLLSPWYGGSHKRWADGLQAASIHEIDIYSLPARHWKWRMHGAAVTLAQQVLAAGKHYDLFLADDMMDVAVFSSLIKENGQHAPIYTYFHENQICYPVSPVDTDIANVRDHHYGWVNFTTALVSKKLLFNSMYHKAAFLDALPEFLSRFPDYHQNDLVPEIAEKSQVLPLGMDLKALDACKPETKVQNERPQFLWNHRWEYDKCPGDFIRLLLDLRKRDLEVDVVLLGERSGESSPEMDVLLESLGDHILCNGEVKEFKDYAKWLWRADIAPVTAIHDFFGGSVIEALFCQCHVLLPDRLAYPEHVAGRELFYTGYDELLEKAVQLIKSGNWQQPATAGEDCYKYDWSSLICEYDRVFSSPDWIC